MTMSDDDDDDSVGEIKRQFPPSHYGPYIVSIREIQFKLTPIKFAMYINSRYKSVVEIKQFPGRMKVTMSDREEANMLVYDTTFEKYKIYVPADEVEVCGVVNVNDINDITDLSDIIKNGKGKFSDPRISPAQIVDAKVLQRISPVNSNEAVATDQLKVTFAGCILPIRLLIHGLLVKVCPYHQKVMFCDRCLQLKHTSKYCNKKPKCNKCQGAHLSQDCTAAGVDATICPYCTQSPNHNINVCPEFKSFNSSFNREEHRKRQLKYSEAVAAANSAENPIIVTQNIANIAGPSFSKVVNLELPTANRFETLGEINDLLESSSSTHVPEKRESLPRRPLIKNPWAKASVSKRERSRKRRRVDNDSPAPVNRSNYTQREDSREPANPPGFRTLESSIKDIITIICNKLGISTAIASLIVSVISPLITAIIPNLRNLLNTLAPTLISSLNG